MCQCHGLSRDSDLCEQICDKLGEFYQLREKAIEEVVEQSVKSRELIDSYIPTAVRVLREDVDELVWDTRIIDSPYLVAERGDLKFGSVQRPRIDFGFTGKLMTTTGRLGVYDVPDIDAPRLGAREISGSIFEAEYYRNALNISVIKGYANPEAVRMYGFADDVIELETIYPCSEFHKRTYRMLVDRPHSILMTLISLLPQGPLTQLLIEAVLRLISKTVEVEYKNLNGDPVRVQLSGFEIKPTIEFSECVAGRTVITRGAKWFDTMMFTMFRGLLVKLKLELPEVLPDLPEIRFEASGALVASYRDYAVIRRVDTPFCSAHTVRPLGMLGCIRLHLPAYPDFSMTVYRFITER